MIKTIEKAEIAEIEEKKSKFIAQIYPVQKEEQVKDILQKTKKNYKGARHHCFAYRILKEEQLIEKSSDDGEPAGTAGQPILNHLKGAELQNVLIIVTRFFGGILLGTGGLTKAYGDSAKKAIEKTKIVYQDWGYIVEVEISYANFQNLEYEAKKRKWNIQNKTYSENIKAELEIPKKMWKDFTNLNSNKTIKLEKYNILEEKFIDI